MAIEAKKIPEKFILEPVLDTTYLQNLMNVASGLPWFAREKDGTFRVFPTSILDFTDSTVKMVGVNNPLHVQIVDATNLTYVSTFSQPAYGVGIASNSLQTAASMLILNSATPVFEPVHTPTKWFNALISANGSTAIWTSAAGKKARLMSWRATIVSGTTAAAACIAKVFDVAADTGIGVQICGAVLGAVGSSTIIANESFMNGYLMAATNTAVNINLSSALGVAGIHVQVVGDEE